eukprot:4245736-Prymnesium_polylepis.3
MALRYENRPVRTWLVVIHHHCSSSGAPRPSEPHGAMPMSIGMSSSSSTTNAATAQTNAAVSTAKTGAYIALRVASRNRSRLLASSGGGSSKAAAADCAIGEGKAHAMPSCSKAALTLTTPQTTPSPSSSCKSSQDFFPERARAGVCPPALGPALDLNLHGDEGVLDLGRQLPGLAYVDLQEADLFEPLTASGTRLVYESSEQRPRTRQH